MQVDGLAKLDTRNSILDPRFSKTSRIEARVKFRDIRKFIKTVQEFIESSFETFEWEKQRTFHVINFWHVWILRKVYFFTGRSILIPGP